MVTLTSYYSGEQFKVWVVPEDELPRGCDVLSYVTDEKTMLRYTVYKDCVDGELYAVQEEN